MKKTIRAVLLVAFFLVFSFFFNKDNNANAFPYSSIAECKAAMGSYYDIADVSQFYCPTGVEDNWYYGGVNQICATWLGSGTDTTIKVNSLSGTVATQYSGFCSYGTSAAYVETYNDNDSVGDGIWFTRNTWPSIGYSASVNIDIAKFAQGVTPYSCFSGGYNCYTRTINVGRSRSGPSVIGYADVNQDFTIAVPVSKYTLKGYAVNSAGTLLQSSPICSVEVNSGSSASCSAPSFTGYDFKGWRTSQTSGTPSGSSPYKVTSLTSNTTVYAVYEKKKYTLKGYAVNGAGTLLQSNPICNTEASHGSSASCSAPGITGYDFKGWRTSQTSGTPSGSSPYTVSSLTSNTTIYAVYEKKKYKLTLDAGSYTSISVTRGSTGLGNGATLYYDDTIVVNMTKNDCADWAKHSVNGTNYNSGTSFTVTSDINVVTRATWRTYTLSINQGTGTTISVTRGSTTLANGASISCGDKVSASFGLQAGYSWGSHSFVGKNINNTSSLSISDHVVDANVTVTASAVRDAYSAQASVAQGENWSGTTNRAQTGYVSSDTSKTITVPCVNAGCKANYWLQLRRDAGSHNTVYWTSSTRSGANPVWSAQVTSNFSAANPMLILGSSGNVGKIESFKPGQGKCYHLAFRPYGSYANDTWKQVYACANAEVSNFEGRSSVSGSASGNTGWVNSVKSSTYNANNCSGGCSVTLTHELRRTKGIGSTDYKVVRTSNHIYSTRSIANNNNLKSGTFGTTSQTNNQAYNITSNSLTLYPGMVICEKMTFKPHNNVESPASDVSTTICASALGDAQPPDPSDPDAPENPNQDSGDTSFINIKVRNKNVSRYSNYQRTVYAKPGDHIFFRATYNPVLQYTYLLQPQQMRINSGTVYNGGGNSLGALYNANKGSSLRNWNNGFAVQLAYDSKFNDSSASTIRSLTYTAGDVTKRSDVNEYNTLLGVLPSDTGKSIDERAITNLNATVQTTPGQVTFTNNGGNNLANVLTTNRSKIAYAKVPYNYDTDLKITTKPEDKLLYAGEGEQKITMEITIKPKYNSQTMNTGDPNYSTKIGNPRYKLVVFRPNGNVTQTSAMNNGNPNWGNDNICSMFQLSNDEVNCGYSEEYNLTNGKASHINDNPKTHADNVKSVESPTFNVQDLEAGQQICVAAAFWPSSSGAETNLDANGSRTWRVSKSVCYTVAKKPTMQIWGGTITTAGAIGGAITTKNNFVGRSDSPFSVSHANGNSRTFGSWDEIGVFSAGVVNSFGSGASMGYSSMNGSNFTHDPGGYASNGTSQPPCEKLSTLTIAAEKTSSSNINTHEPAITCTKNIDLSQINGYSDIGSQVTQEKSALIGMFMVPVKDAEGNEKLASGDVALDNGERNEWENSVGAHYYHGKDNLTVPGQSVILGTTHVVHSEANVYITGNLIYDQASGYQKLSDVSKLVIYAQGNIYINCNVNRVDAMLVADGTVVTCGDTTTDLSDNAIRSNINNPANSNPLVINGTIVAGRLIANRTYGMATGNNSIIPAEIINYDPTLYLWGAEKIDVTSSGKVHITYSKELPPRY